MASNKEWSTPEELANNFVGQILSGFTGGFRPMIDNPLFSVNTIVRKYSVFQWVCKYKLEDTAIELLLHPTTDINALHLFDEERNAEANDLTALYIAVFHCCLKVAKEIITNKRFSHQRIDGADVTAIASLAVSEKMSRPNRAGFAELFKLLIAYRGKSIDVHGNMDEFTPQRIDEYLAKHGIFQFAYVAISLRDEPEKTIHKMRKELGLNDAEEVMALIAFMSDGFLRIKNFHGKGSLSFWSAKRFMTIASKLPVELQMMLCNRLHDKAKDYMLSTTLGPVMTDLARELGHPSSFSSP